MNSTFYVPEALLVTTETSGTTQTHPWASCKALDYMVVRHTYMHKWWLSKVLYHWLEEQKDGCCNYDIHHVTHMSRSNLVLIILNKLRSCSCAKGDLPLSVQIQLIENRLGFLNHTYNFLTPNSYFMPAIDPSKQWCQGRPQASWCMDMRYLNGLSHWCFWSKST